MKANILDTNIFIRLLIGDIPTQLETAKKIFKEIESGKYQGLVSILVLNEIIWITEHFYKVKRSVYLPQILQLLALKNLKVIEAKKPIIITILKRMLQKKIDFTDIYLMELANRTKKPIFSFDRDISNSA